MGEIHPLARLGYPPKTPSKLHSTLCINPCKWTFPNCDISCIMDQSTNKTTSESDFTSSVCEKLCYSGSQSKFSRLMNFPQHKLCWGEVHSHHLRENHPFHLPITFNTLLTVTWRSGTCWQLKGIGKFWSQPKWNNEMTEICQLCRTM